MYRECTVKYREVVSRLIHLYPAGLKSKSASNPRRPQLGAASAMKDAALEDGSSGADGGADTTTAAALPVVHCTLAACEKKRMSNKRKRPGDPHWSGVEHGHEFVAEVERKGSTGVRTLRLLMYRNHDGYTECRAPGCSHRQWGGPSTESLLKLQNHARANHPEVSSDVVIVNHKTKRRRTFKVSGLSTCLAL